MSDIQTIAVDAMGGDHAPEVVAEGVAMLLDRGDSSVRIVLTGPENHLKDLLTDHLGNDRLNIVNATEVIGMSESPSKAVRSKQDSSIHVGLGLVKAGRASAFASAGNTGAIMAASMFILGRATGVSRPTVAGVYPTVKGGCVAVDIGTNVDCKPEHLVQFGVMGSLYASGVLGKENPTVGLLNVGEEPGKGNEQTKEAFTLMGQQDLINFAGNIEGRDIFMHGADVVVSDGFVGNIVLKLGESIATFIPQMIEREMRRQELSVDKMQMVGQILNGVKKSFDYEEFGGAPLLGVNGTVVIGHGGSTPKAVATMITSTAHVAERNLPAAIESALSA